ncbi:hypothetical protein P154DRAFT_523390 [Amniculicola lignicola CBS 123094]|uniref:Uncharacterized protein n=1 Tax=Amniculicola lignicola CBS 123094 TaxID=1392246 RepID=A0A6A5WE65_9PLEO|nr:hypothetical protein P154DRAFT_523390 [Amniculicola lignicola CBS 123094]
MWHNYWTESDIFSRSCSIMPPTPNNRASAQLDIINFIIQSLTLPTCGQRTHWLSVLGQLGQIGVANFVTGIGEGQGRRQQPARRSSWNVRGYRGSDSAGYLHLHGPKRWRHDVLEGKQARWGRGSSNLSRRLPFEGRGPATKTTRNKA